MRLINVETWRLESFAGDDPPYAILSHTWGPDDQELSFQDLVGKNTSEPEFGIKKLEGCCNQAKKDGLQYIWIDTCCINKENSRELNEAINSMFRWYQNASVCYTFLSDVLPDEDPCDIASKFRSSRWFQRGWTLQELLAPKKLCFFNQEWISIGSKVKMADVITAITGVPRKYLLGWDDFRQASVAQRMSWMANRATSRKEDIAYCLLGIFGVALPMMYGTSDLAFGMLQEEIMKKTGDHSILAWGLDIPDDLVDEPTDALSAGVLSTSPSDFANCRHIISSPRNATHSDTLSIAGGCLLIHLPLHTTPAGKTYGLLNCGPENDTEQVVGLPVFRIISDTGSDEYLRPQGYHAVLFPRNMLETTTKLVRIRTERASRSSELTSRRFWLYVDSQQEVNLELVEDYPPIPWDQGRAVMAEAASLDEILGGRYLARFRANEQALKDVVVVIEYEIRELRLHARSHVMALSRDTSLQEFSHNFIFFRPEALGKHTANNGIFNVKVQMREEQIRQEPNFVVGISRDSDSSKTTTDGSLELHQVKLQLELVEMLQKEDRIRLETRQAILQTDRRMNNLIRMKERLTIMEEHLKKFREQKAALSEEIGKAVHEVDDFTNRLDAARQKEAEFLGPGSRMQQSLDELETNQNSRNWLETIIKKHLDTGEAEAFPKSSKNHNALQLLTVTKRSCNTENPSPLSWAAANGYRAISTLLLDGGIDLETKHEDGNTPLLLAALNGHEAVVLLLLERGANFEVKNNDGDTPLLLSAQIGSEAVVRILLERGARIETRNRDYYTPLVRAAINRHAPTMRLLMQRGASLETKIDENGNTILLSAALNGQVMLVTLLLDEGAGLETKNSNGDTPLSTGAQNGHEAIVRLLLERGADLETQNRHGDTPLARAALNGHEGLVRILLDEGANLEATNNNGSTPILRAIMNGHEAVVEVLLEAGADFERRNKSGETPLSRAAFEGYDTVARLLVDEGANPETKDQDGYTPLSLGARKGHESVVRLLTERGADLETKNKYGDTPLARAALNGHKGIVSMLLRKGANLETTNNNGSTPLFHAILSGHEAVVRVLLEEGANFEKVNKRGDTPMSRAVSRGYDHLARLLLERGASLQE